VAYSGLLAAVFPSIKRSADFSKLVESYPDLLKTLFGLSGDFTTGPGYLDAELFSLMLPLLAIVLAVGSGSRAIAGEEEAGRLELVLAYPVRRRDAVLARGAAVAVEVGFLCAAEIAALAVLDPVVGLDLRAGRLVAGVAGVGLLACAYGWVALVVSAVLPSRGLAIGAAAAAAAAGYLIGGLHSTAAWLDPFRFLSPFWWVGQAPLRNGVDGGGVAVVAAGALMLLAAAAVLFEHRDLRTA
jgi:beta-exotoxin I transport system permease protein